MNLSLLYRLSGILSWVTMLLVWLAITSINNHFFYKNRDLTEQRKYEQFAKIYSSMYDSCLDQIKNIPICKNQLKSTIENSNIMGTTRLRLLDGRLILSIDNERYHDNRSSVSTHIILGRGSSGLILEFIKLSSPPLADSVARSITFSFLELLSKIKNDEPISDFIWQVALPRSGPAWSFWIVLLLLSLIIKFRKNAILAKYEAAENNAIDSKGKLEKAEEEILSYKSKLSTLMKNHNDSSIEKLILEEKQAQLEQDLNALINCQASPTGENDEISSRINELMKTIELVEKQKSKIEQKNKELQETVSEQKNKIQDKEASLISLKKENDSLQASLTKQEQGISSEVKYVNKRIIKILLCNPDVTTGSGDFNFNKGAHHSKDFVIKLHNALLQDDALKKIVSSITPTEYGPRRRNNADLVFDRKKHTFALNVYENSDAGYAAQITLHANEIWKAVIQAKCLITTLNPLKNMKLNFKVTDVEG